jgi:hypothetical protein
MTNTDPVDTLFQLSASYCVPRCLHAVANLGVADALGDEPAGAAALAARTGAHAGALDRVLRLLAAHGVFHYQDGRISHNPASRLLRADHPQSLRQFVRMFGIPAFWDVIGGLEHSIRTGEPCDRRVLPGGLWGFLSSHPEESRTFDDAMAAKAHGQVAGVVASYDFSGFRSICDVGGGRGHLLQAVLERAPQATGILFDQPHVVAGAAGAASDRLRLQGGDFFRDELPACDAYLIMEVIHDWDDASATRILRAIRRAAPAHARLLMIEAILPEDPGPNWPKLLDIVMLAISGRQRTQREYADLLRASGFELLREINTGAGASILEAAPA